MNLTSEALDTVLNDVAKQRGAAIQDEDSFRDYLGHGGLVLNEEGVYCYELDGEGHQIEYRPSVDELERHGTIVSTHDKGFTLYRIADMEFIKTATGQVVSRHEDPLIAAYFPINI